jgi:hypothetical protein
LVVEINNLRLSQPFPKNAVLRKHLALYYRLQPHVYVTCASGRH